MKGRKNSLPKNLYHYFWDIDAKTLNIQKYPQYVIERLLEYGDPEALRWLFKNFSKREIRKILYRTRALSPRTAHFWAGVLDIDKKDVLCLQKHFLARRRVVWPY
jgi:hypothetical protein